MIDLLQCPHCHGRLASQGRVWRCATGHAFDIAHQGYVNLTVGPPVHTGDSADMLDARAGFLAAGHFDLVTDALIRACRGLPPGALVEVGAGTAHHLKHVRHALGPRPAIALDASVAAGKRAARADPPWVTAVIADAWQPWPLLDGVAAAILTIFAPRNLPQTARVLAPQGQWIIVTPAADHLGELAKPLGLIGVGTGKLDRLRDEARAYMEMVDTREIRTVRGLTRREARAAAMMGPSAHHLTEEALDAGLARLPEQVPVTIAVHVTRFARGYRHR